MTAAKKPEPKFPAESRTVHYLPAGVGVDPYAGNEPTLDPELEKARESDIKANDVEVFSSFEEPTIDPELVKAREEEIKRDAKRAGINTAEPTKAEAPKAPAKKSTSK